MTTVVVATTDSPSCRRALDRVTDVFTGADVVVATAVPGTDAAAGVPTSVLRTTLDELAVDAASSLVRQRCRGVRGRARPVVLRGDPVDALCALAEREGAEAIVVGSLGGPGYSSLGDALARRAPCPVVELGS